MGNTNEDASKKDFRVYTYPRIIAAVLMTVAVLWGGTKAMDFFTDSPEQKSQYHQAVDKYPALKKASVLLTSALDTNHEPASAKSSKTEPTVAAIENKEGHEAKAPASEDTPTHGPDNGLRIPDAHEPKTDAQAPKADTQAPKAVTGQPAHGAPAVAIQVRVQGSAFVTALIEPMDYELNERPLGWRPNDQITFFTDNVKNKQLGVLEVTRRTAEKLVERIARTGSSITFDRDLDLARTRFMNDPTKFWMPSAEAAYGKGIEALKRYRKRLHAGKGTFHSRADNLVPLLSAYYELLGDCDENLIKREERNGDIVSTFKADDYFYYAQGVAKAMVPILEAVMIDFEAILESRGATADLYKAIQMLKGVTELDPLFVQESKLNGLFANHRANMATAVSHSRSYIRYVIRILTT